MEMEIKNPDLKNFSFKEKLGNGPFSEEIFKIYDNLKQKFFLAKVFQTNEDTLPFLNCLKKEIATLKVLDHENIIKIIDIIETSETYMVIMEDCNEGFFSEKLKKQEELVGLSDKKAKRYGSQLVEAFKVLNEKHVVVWNFSFEKVFIHEGVLKIAGLGYERELNDDMVTESTAPEILKGLDSDKTNIWSLGVAFYRLLHGEFPFSGNNKEELLQSISKPNLYFEDPKCDLDENSKQILRKMLLQDPEERVEWEELYEKFPLEKMKEKFIEKSKKTVYFDKKTVQFGGVQQNFMEKQSFLSSKSEQFMNNFNPEESKEDIKKKANLHLETRYMHLKNIIEFYVKVFLEAKPFLLTDDIDLYLNFAWKKHVLLIYYGVYNSLKEKKNIFNDPNFDDFNKSMISDRIEQYLKNLGPLYEEMLLDGALEIKAFGTEDDEHFWKVQKYLKNDEFEGFPVVYKQIFFEFILRKRFQQLQIPNEDMRTKNLVQLMKMVDCFDYRNAFSFRNEKEGFDFEGYCAQLEIKKDVDLMKSLDEKFQRIFPEK